MLKLENKRHALAKTLSGGMKRKLSVGIALCAGSKVIGHKNWMFAIFILHLKFCKLIHEKKHRKKI